MARDEHAIDWDAIEQLSKLAGLPLPEDRQAQLQQTLSAYRANVARLRRIDPGDCEPPAITYESEVRR